MKTTLRAGLLLALAWGILMSGQQPPARAADNEGTPDAKEVQDILKKAVDFLKKQQKEDGSFSRASPAPASRHSWWPGSSATASAPTSRSSPRRIAYLEKNVKKDGGIYDKGLTNYTTSVAIMAFEEANKGGKYDTILKNGAGLPQDAAGRRRRSQGRQVRRRRLRPARNAPTCPTRSIHLDALIAAGVPRTTRPCRRPSSSSAAARTCPARPTTSPSPRRPSEDDKGGLTYVPLDTDDKMHTRRQKAACARWAR